MGRGPPPRFLPRSIFCAVFDAHISSFSALNLQGNTFYAGYLEGFNWFREMPHIYLVFCVLRLSKV